MAGFERAVQELYQVPAEQFVAERKRLAGELKREGDAAAAKQLLARKRPTISAWVVNQLYWHARDAFDRLMETAGRLRKGDLRASGDHREAIAALRKRASTILTDAGHNPTESTLRRVSTTLAALAASGGFYPDPPGALAEDRDPPGFEAAVMPLEHVDEEPEEAPKPKHAHHGHKHAHKKHDGTDDLAAARAAAEKKRAEDMAEKRRAEAERKRLAAERHRLEAALRNAKGAHADAEREVKQAEKQLEHAQKGVEKAQALIDDLEQKLEELAN